MHHSLRKKMNKRARKATPLTRAIRSSLAVGSVIAFALLRPAHATELDVNALVLDSQKAAAPVSADCYKDDERLVKLADFMAGLAGQTKPAPLRLTSETFAKLRPDVVATLKGNYEVLRSDCTAIPTANGMPVEKVELDFVDLSNRAAEAAGQNDDATLQYIRKAFRAAPIKAADAGPIFGPAPLSSEVAAYLSKTWGLRVVSSNTGNVSVDHYALLLAQLFQATGGKITDGKVVSLQRADEIAFGTRQGMISGDFIEKAQDQAAGAFGVTLKRIQ